MRTSSENMTTHSLIVACVSQAACSPLSASFDVNDNRKALPAARNPCKTALAHATGRLPHNVEVSIPDAICWSQASASHFERWTWCNRVYDQTGKVYKKWQSSAHLWTWRALWLVEESCTYHPKGAHISLARITARYLNGKVALRKSYTSVLFFGHFGESVKIISEHELHIRSIPIQQTSYAEFVWRENLWAAHRPKPLRIRLWRFCKCWVT